MESQIIDQSKEKSIEETSNNKIDHMNKQGMYTPFKVVLKESEALEPCINNDTSKNLVNDNEGSRASPDDTSKKILNDLGSEKKKKNSEIGSSQFLSDSDSNGSRASPEGVSEQQASNKFRNENTSYEKECYLKTKLVGQLEDALSSDDKSWNQKSKGDLKGNKISSVQDLKKSMNRNRLPNDQRPVQVGLFEPDDVQIDLTQVEVVRKARRYFNNEKNMGIVSINNGLDYIHGGGSVLGRNPAIRGRSDLVLFAHDNITEKDAILHMIQMLTVASYEMTVPLLLYVLQSMLNRLFRLAEAEPRHILWVKGASGSHKSNLTSMYANVFNTHQDNDIELSAFDTIPAILEYINGVSDMAVIVDDFIPSEDNEQIKHQSRLGSQLRRTIGDRKTKKKLQRIKGESSYTIAKSPHPDIGIICTAEDEPVGESDVARLTIVEYEKKYVDVVKAQHFRKTRTIYSTGIFHLLRFVMFNGHQIIDYIEERSTQMRMELKQRFVHDRFIDAYISMRITKGIFCEYLEEKQIMSLDQINRFSTMCNDVLWNLYCKNSYDLIEQKPAVMFVKSIFSQVASGTVYLEALDSQRDMKGTRIGFVDAQSYYLIPEVAMKQCIQFYRSIGRVYPASIRKTLSDLQKHNLIFTANESRDGKNTVVRTIKLTLRDVKNYRFIVMNRNEVDKLL
ncbi:MAG: hypothetical protein JXR88_08830 [Clostridia bacterium]|nr:hypothetical protein [Clostridia bacterium]